MIRKMWLYLFTLGAFVFSSGFFIYELVNNRNVTTVRETEWAIGIYKGDTPLSLSSAEGVVNPVLRASDVKDVKATFVADPFLIKKDSMFYMFFEVFNDLTRQGDIGLAISRDCKKWTYSKIVLDEVYHISYPYVFEWRDGMYMIPESAQAGELKLYKAGNFPEEWQYVKTLLTGEFGDHSLFQYQDKWWLFAGADPYNNSSLRLFYSDSLMGSWVEHPKSPIIHKNANKARPGGRVIVYEDRVYRFAQDCDPTYGAELNAFEVTALTDSTYEERSYDSNPILKAHGKGWARHGMHQLDLFQLSDGKWIGCVDGYKKSFAVKVEY